MLRRKTDESYTTVFALLPPVQLFDPAHSILGKPCLETQGHEEERIVFLGEAFDRGQVQVIVVVVRDNYYVNLWQTFEGQTGRT